MARARNYGSCLEAALSNSHIPIEVFHNLIRTFRANLPTWHRYWEIPLALAERPRRGEDAFCNGAGRLAPKGGGPSSSPAYPSPLGADHPTVDLPGGTTDVLSCRTATDSRLAKRHLRTLA